MSAESTRDSGGSAFESGESPLEPDGSAFGTRESVVDSRESVTDSRGSAVVSRESAADSRGSGVNSAESARDSCGAACDPGVVPSPEGLKDIAGGNAPGTCQCPTSRSRRDRTQPLLSRVVDGNAHGTARAVFHPFGMGMVVRGVVLTGGVAPGSWLAPLWGEEIAGDGVGGHRGLTADHDGTGVIAVRPRGRGCGEDDGASRDWRVGRCRLGEPICLWVGRIVLA